MNGLDWAVLIAYFGVMVAIGVWSHKRVDDVSDFFTAGGKMPWWLSGISHHMSGYSAVMFTGYAGIAYTYGVTSFVTWSFPIALGIAHRLQAVRAAHQPVAFAAPCGLPAGVPEEPLRPEDPAGAGLVRGAAEDRGRGRQVGRDRHPVVRLHRHLPQPGHPHHRRDHGRLLHDRRPVGRRAHRIGPVRHPAAGRRRDVRRRRRQTRRPRRLLRTSGTSPRCRATGSRWSGPYGTVFLLAFLFIKLFEYNGGMLEPGPAVHGDAGPRGGRARPRGCPRSCGWSGRWSCSSRCGCPRCWSTSTEAGRLRLLRPA